MLQLLVATVRGRAVSLIGSFLAVLLSVTIIAAAGILIDSRNRVHVTVPTRLAAVSLVAQSGMSVDQTSAPTSAPTPNGNPPPVQLHERPRLPASLLDQVRAQPGVREAVGDLAFYAQIVDARGRPLAGRGGTASEGHPWSSAALTPFDTRAGRAPMAPSEVAIDADQASRGNIRVGDVVEVLSAAGARQFTVVGIVAPAGGVSLPTEASLFFAGPAVPELSGAGDKLDAIGVFAAPGTDVGQLRQRLLTGLNRPGLEISTPRELSQQETRASIDSFNLAISFLAVLGVLATFVAVFVSSNTFAIAIIQRNREIALLRAVGATTRQVQLLLVGEAIMVALVAAAFGCIGGIALASPIAPVLSDAGMAPSGFRTHVTLLPLAVAIGAGVASSLLAVVAAAWRAARIRPVEALQEASVERRGISRARLVGGIVVMGLGGLAVFGLSTPGGGVARATYVVVAALVVSVGVAMLGPLVVQPLGWLLGQPLTWLTRATGVLAQSNMVAHARRTASATTPLMLTVALGCIVLFETGTINHVQVERASQWLKADYVLQSYGGSGLPASVADTVARVPGVAAAPGAMDTSVFLVNRSFNPMEGEAALGVDPARIGGALDFGVKQGSLGDLHGDAVALSATVARDHGYKVGDAITIWFADGSPGRVRLVAVLSDGIPQHAVLPHDLASRHSFQQLDGAVYVKVAPGADRQVVAARLQRELLPYATAVIGRDTILTQIETPPLQGQLPLYTLVGVLVIFTAVAIVNTLVMATAERVREFALLRLIGTTRAQVVRMVGWEAAIVILIGVLQGTLLTALALLAFSRTLTGRIDVAVDPRTYASIVAVCTLLGFGASLLPAWLALRAKPVQALATRE